MKIAITTPVYVNNAEHQRFLDMTTKSLVSVDHDLVFIPVENYINEDFYPLAYSFDHVMDDVQIVKGRQPQGVSKAWNDGIGRAQALGCDYVIVMNHDIVLKSNAIDRLVAFAEKTKCLKCGGIGKDIHYMDKECPYCANSGIVMWTMSAYADLALLEEAPEDENYSEHPHFSCFMVRTNFLDQNGTFDENFMPAYLEDGDMHARLALAGVKAYIYGGARFYHFGSRTIKSDQGAWKSNESTFPANQQYFLDKWGHPPVGDVERMREVYFKHPYNEEDKPLSYWRK